MLLTLYQIFIFLLSRLHFLLHIFFAFMENLFMKHPIYAMIQCLETAVASSQLMSTVLGFWTASASTARHRFLHAFSIDSEAVLVYRCCNLFFRPRFFSFFLDNIRTFFGCYRPLPKAKKFFSGAETITFSSKKR